MEISWRIRHAIPGDANAIRRLCWLLNVRRKSDLESGFVELPIPSTQRLERWIEGNELFYIAEDLGKVIGFIACYDDVRLDQLSDRKCALERFVLEQAKPFVYADLRGIEREYARQGIGELLADTIIGHPSNRGKDIWGAVSLRPFHNKASQSLHLRKGFTLEGEVDIGDGLVFGMYKRSGVVGLESGV